VCLHLLFNSFNYLVHLRYIHCLEVLANASHSLDTTSISACFVLILAVHGWSSFCLTLIWLWNTCVLSTQFKLDRCYVL
jgi:hypothetical protein